MARFAYNSATHEATKITPFYANYGYEPKWTKAPRPGPLAEKARLTAEQMKALHEEMRKGEDLPRKTPQDD